MDIPHINWEEEKRSAMSATKMLGGVILLGIIIAIGSIISLYFVGDDGLIYQKFNKDGTAEYANPDTRR